MEDTKHIKISEFNYPLPDERIAKFPLANRDESKLLIYRHGEVNEDHFTSLPDYLETGEMMVFNNTKVIQARLHFRKETGALIEVGAVKIDVQTKMVFIDGEAVVFSKKEFEILSLLASHPGQIYSREDMIAELWKDAPYVLDRTVDVHIARIRSKLGTCKNYLTNRTGYGYVFNAV